MNIPVFTGPNFNSAFRKARKALGPNKIFRWGNSTYNTNYADEVPRHTVSSANLSKNLPTDDNHFLIDDIAAEYGYKKLTTGANAGKYQHNGKLYTLQQVVNILTSTGKVGTTGVETQAGGFGKTPYYMPGITVTANFTKVSDKTPGFLPVEAPATQNPVYQNYETGIYYMTDPRDNHIIATALTPDALTDLSLWEVYHTGIYGDYILGTLLLVRNIAQNQQAENDLYNTNRLITGNLHYLADPNGNIYVDENGQPLMIGELSSLQHEGNMRAALNTAAAAFDYPVSLFNHTFSGLAALPSQNYSWLNYLNGFNGNGNTVYGLGDILNLYGTNFSDVNTYALNTLVNPMTVLTTGASAIGSGTFDGAATNIKNALSPKWTLGTRNVTYRMASSLGKPYGSKPTVKGLNTRVGTVSELQGTVHNLNSGVSRASWNLTPYQTRSVSLLVMPKGGMLMSELEWAVPVWLRVDPVATSPSSQGSVMYRPIPGLMPEWTNYTPIEILPPEEIEYAENLVEDIWKDQQLKDAAHNTVYSNPGKDGKQDGDVVVYTSRGHKDYTLSGGRAVKKTRKRLRRRGNKSNDR